MTSSTMSFFFVFFKYPGGNSPSFIWEMKAKLAKTMCVKYDL